MRNNEQNVEIVERLLHSGIALALCAQTHEVVGLNPGLITYLGNVSLIKFIVKCRTTDLTTFKNLCLAYALLHETVHA